MNFQLFAKFYNWVFSALKQKKCCQSEKPVRTELPVVRREWEQKECCQNSEKCQFEKPVREWENREWEP